MDYAWDFGDGNTDAVANPTHTYAADGTYLVCLTVWDAFGCESTFCDTLVVDCSAPPSCNAAYIFIDDDCPQVSFLDASYTSPGDIISWMWDFGDGTTASTPDETHTYTANGTYTTCLTISTTDGCTDTHCDTINVLCIAPPACQTFFQYTLGLCPTVAFFDGSTASPGSVSTWSWDFGDGNSANSQNPQHTYSANGLYVVCLTTSTTDGCVDTHCDTINVSCITPPVCDADFQYTLGGCPDVSFFDASTASPGSVGSWSWSFGDGGSSAIQNPTHNFGANGTYVTCLTISTTDNCTSTYCDTVSISCIAPVSCSAFFQYTLGNCPDVSFFDGSTASPGSVNSWFWDFGDGGSASTQNPTHAYSANGTYVTCLTISTSDSCTSTYCDTLTISCIAPVSCSAFYQYTLGNCPDVSFFDGSTASPGSVNSWFWDFGDGGSASTQNPTHTYSANGTYVTCLTISTSDSCTSTYCDTVSISCITPVSCIAWYNTTVTNCADVSFIDASYANPGNVTSWSWNFGDGSTSNSQSPTHSYTANGSYVSCVTITTSDSCTSSYCDTINISCIPPTTCNAFFQYTSGNCPDVSFFDGSAASPGSVATWLWDFGDGSGSVWQNPTHTYSANGTYVVCQTITTTDSCTSTYCDTVTISCISPVSCSAFFEYTLGNCPDVSFFDGSAASPGSVATWLWDFGDGSGSVWQNPTHTYSANGTYVVCQTITTTDSCTSAYCDTITISCIQPTTCNADFVFNSLNCPSVSFQDSSSASPGSVISWAWSFGDGSTSTMKNPSHEFSANGTYVTCLSITTSDSCTSTYCDTITISCIIPHICAANFQYSGSCPEFGFSDLSTSSPDSIVSWNWSFGDGTTSTDQYPPHTYTSNGQYLVCLTVGTSNGCSSTHCDTIAVTCITPIPCGSILTLIVAKRSRLQMHQ